MSQTEQANPDHVFPLYLYPDSEELELVTERSINLKPDFLKALSEQLRLPQTRAVRAPPRCFAGGDSRLYLRDLIQSCLP